MARWIVFEGGWQTLLPLLVLGGIAARCAGASRRPAPRRVRTHEQREWSADE